MQDEYVTEQEAAKRCGVSAKTLERFVETGNLRCEKSDDGKIFYNRRLLSAIFGVTFGGQKEDSLTSIGAAVVESHTQPSSHHSLPPPRQALFDDTLPGPDDRLEREILKLQNICDMQEKLLEIRESQLEELKEQRTWLQNRIEKLEQAASEDRILLLQSSETARRLAAKERRSPIRALLEWTGVVPASADTSDSDPKVVNIK